MSQNDPTDHALAAIASILDHKESPEARAPDGERGWIFEPGTSASGTSASGTSVSNASASKTSVHETIIRETSIHEFVIHETVAPETAFDDETDEFDTAHAAMARHESPATAPEAIDVETYSRVGPGPLDAIRFRWTARRDDAGAYFVDETIGSNSRPISSGPMPRHEVIQFIDDREHAARQRFNELKSEMTIGHRANADTSETHSSETWHSDS